MKKLLILFVMMFALSFVVTSCGDEENPGGGTACNQATDASYCTGAVLSYCDGATSNWATQACPDICANVGGTFQCTTDSGDTADTGADTADTGADTADTGADTADTGADTADTGADTADTGADTADSGDTGGGYAAPYGSVTLNGALTYVLTNETSIDSTMVVMSAYATGTMGSGNIVPMSQGIYSLLQFSEDATNGNSFGVQQVPFNDDGATMVNPLTILSIPEANFAVGSDIPVGFGEDDIALIYMIDVDSGGAMACMHAFAIGTMNITEANGAPGAAGSFTFNGTLELYSPANATPYGGDISGDLGVTACAPY